MHRQHVRALALGDFAVDPVWCLDLDAGHLAGVCARYDSMAADQPFGFDLAQRTFAGARHFPHAFDDRALEAG